MAFDIKGLRTSVYNLINKNNTATSSYDISANLNARVNTVIAGYQKAPVINILYPVVWIELNRDSEEYNSLGQSSRRDVRVVFDVIAETNYGMGQYDGRVVSDDEMITLTQNLKDLFRNHTNLSSTCEWAEMTSTEYDVQARPDETWGSIGRITLEVNKLVT